MKQVHWELDMNQIRAHVRPMPSDEVWDSQTWSQVYDQVQAKVQDRVREVWGRVFNHAADLI